MTTLSTFNFNFEGNVWKFRVRDGTFDAGIIQEVAYDPFYAMSRLWIDENSTVIDIGAHIGAFSVLAAARGARVLALEPTLENFRLLEENLRLNRLPGIVKPIKAALWTTDGVLEIKKPPPDEVNTGAGGFFYDDPRALTETVECISLSTLFEREGVERCALLKMDCEGAELKILPALTEQIFDKIDAIVLEYHLQQETDLRELLRVLYSRNFLIDWEERTDSLGMLIGFRESKLEAEIFQPLNLPWVVSPVIVDSRISRLPLLGSVERRMRGYFHSLVIFYLNQYLAQYSLLIRRNSLYLRMLLRYAKYQDKF